MDKDASRHRRRRFPLRLAIVAAVLVALYAVAGFFVVPAVARSELVAYMQRHHYRLTVGKVRFNPFALSAQLDNVRLDDPHGNLLGRFDRFYANFQVSSLWHWAPTFADLELINSRFDLSRDSEGHLNWLALLRQLAPPQQQQPAQPGKATGRLVVSKLRIRNLRADYSDRTDGRQFSTTLGPVDLAVNDFSTYNETGSPYHLTVGTPKQGTITWSGTIAVAPLRSTGSFDVKGLPLALLGDYFHKRAAGIAITGGTLGVSGKYRLDRDLVIDGGRVVIGGFGINSSDGGRPLLKIPKLVIAGIHADLDKRKARIKSVSGNRIDVNSARLADGNMLWQHSLASVAATDNAGQAATPATSAAPKTAAASGGTGPGWQLSLSRVSLTGTRASYADETLKPAFSAVIDPIDVELRSVEWPAATVGSLQVNGQATTGGTFSIDGKGRVKPMDMNLTVGVQKLALAVAQPYVSQFAKITIGGGSASADTRLRLQSPKSGPMQVHVTGNAGVDGLDVTGPDGKKKVMAIARLAIKGIAADLASHSLKVDKVTVDKPYASFVVDKDGSTNISRLLVHSTAGKKLAAAPKAAAGARGAGAADAKANSQVGPTLAIGNVAVSDGELEFADRTLIRPFHAVIGKLHGAIAHINPQSDGEASIELNGEVNHYSPVSINGRFAPFGHLKGKVAFSFNNLSLTELNPFAATYAGYVIDQGKLDAHFDYTVDGSRLQGKNHFVIRQIKLGDRVKSPRAIDIPLALGIALLKDSSGTIDLNLPISGDITAPGFDLGSIIGHAFVNAITKTVAAPFKILAGLVGGNAEQLDHMQFDAGSAQLPEQQIAQLDKLAQALKRRPQLGLAVRGTAAPGADAQALAGQQLKARLDAMKPKPVSGESDRWARAYKLYKQETGQSVDNLTRQLSTSGKTSEEAVHKAVWQALLKHETVGSDALRTLANERAAAIVGALSKAGVKPQRIYLRDPDIKAGSEQGRVASRLSVST